MRNTEELCGITTRKAAWYEQKKCETYVNDDLSDAGITGIPVAWGNFHFQYPDIFFGRVHFSGICFGNFLHDINS